MLALHLLLVYDHVIYNSQSGTTAGVSEPALELNKDPREIPFFRQSTTSAAKRPAHAQFITLNSVSIS